MTYYLSYFIFLLRNWNLSLALHIIRREWNGAKKYNIHTTGVMSLKQMRAKGIDTSHAMFYMPAGYDMLERAFAYMQQEGIQDVTDLGCGMGRPLCVAAHYGFTRLTGVDVSPELCAQAKQNLQHTAELFPQMEYNIICGDAGAYTISADTHCIFLFNPFDEVIMQKVAKHISNSLKHARPFYIIYLNDLHSAYFTAMGFQRVYHYTEKVYLEVSIYKKAP
ncbi:MAG TPA: class I SAM-dependent methyltransferase [Ferruginibacter sp.]|nr:class I SAM-dependent methyltransferase [Ferruginibacter sp.]HRO17135.1 class I SAM-dependent methyltransferase [Ferruginibacter sp.]HRQ21500.1 class I SAM-dependent methyltransferase [Ferruginibacter sp.]